MTAAVLGLVFTAGAGTSWLIAYGAGFRKSERMWEAEWEARRRQLGPEPASAAEVPVISARAGVPVWEPDLEEWSRVERLLWPLLVLAAQFWFTPFGEKLDRFAVWLGRFERTFWTERPGPQHRAAALPTWTLPTGGYATVPSRLTETQVLNDLEVDLAIDELVYRQEIGVAA